MAGAAQQGDRLNVFISYSRDDLAFADQLRAALLGFDFAVTIDRENITGGEDWQKRLGLLIRDADTIVFVLSPSSARSSTCAWEAKEAVSLGKRILPILCRPLGDASPPPELAALQYTYFYDEPKFPGSGFGTGLNSLRLALNTDPDWLREHTRYLRLAKEWEEVGKPSDRRLLSAADIELATAWAGNPPIKAPEVTPLQLNFIKASEAEDIRRQSTELRRVREMEEAQRGRAQALAEREKAQEREAEALKGEADARIREAEQARRVARRTLVGLAAAVVLALAASGFAFVAYQQRQTALQATATATTERNNADTQRKLAEKATDAVKKERDNAETATREANEARQETQRQLDRANQALAESIDNDLGVEADRPLTNRQRYALWKLALAEEPVKSDFISILANSGEETARVSAGFAQISRALGPMRPSAVEMKRLLEPLLKTIDQTIDPNALQPLARALQALAPQLSEAQASQALGPLLNKMQQQHDPAALKALAQALGALPAMLTEAQASQGLETLVDTMSSTTWTDDVRALALALQTLAPKLSEAQEGRAIEALVKKIGAGHDYFALGQLAQASRVLAGRLSAEPASSVLEPLLKQMDQTTDSDAASALFPVLQTLGPKLNKASANKVVEFLLRNIRKVKDADSASLRALAELLPDLAAMLNEAQVSQTIELLAKTSGSDPDVLLALARTVRALPANLRAPQASRVFELVFKNANETFSSANMTLGLTLEALAPQLSEEQAQRAGQVLVDRIDFGPMTPRGEFSTLARAAEALRTKISKAQARGTLDRLLFWVKGSSDTDTIETAAEALQALPLQLVPAQASEALNATLNALLTKIGQKTDPSELQLLGEALQSLPEKLSDTQAAQLLKATLDWIGETSDPSRRQALAKAFPALAMKLTDAQIVQASNAAASSLGWAATDDEAAEWARALVTLTGQAVGRDRIRVAAIAYPAAGGSATEILLDAIRAARPDAPTKDKGTQVALEWLAKTYPDVLRPVCPPPLQSDLKCPPQDVASTGQ